MPSDRSEKAVQEFISEAQEIIEALNRDLLILDEQHRQHEFDPDVLNNVFRRVHSLKGLSGMFGAERMSGLSHNLENLLDSLRMGKVALGAPILDLLFESIDIFNGLIGDISRGSDTAGSKIDDLIYKLDRALVVGDDRGVPQPIDEFDLDPGVLAVLTEYEEHRLRENVRTGAALYNFRATFGLMSIDRELEDLKAKVKPIGEIITYLPRSQGADESAIELDIIVGSSRPADEVLAAAAGRSVVATPIPRRAGARGVGAARAAAYTPAPATPPPSAPTPPHAAAPAHTPTPPHAHVHPPVQTHAPAAGPPRAPVLHEPAAMTPTTSSGRHRGVDRSREGGSALDGISEVEGPTVEAEPAESLKSVSQAVRVDIRKLDRLMNIVGELVVSRSAIGEIAQGLGRSVADPSLTIGLHRELRTFERRLAELQEGILEVRMVPLGQIFDKLSRVVRKISREAGKPIDLVIRGADTELDKLIVEELSDPLMHLIRNAIDHGIEDAAERDRAGKLPTGRVVIEAVQRGSHVIIEVEDDGRGIEEASIVRAAIRRHLVDPDTVNDLTRREIMGLLFQPGFTTREGVSQLSGRGVGLDVVKTNIAHLRGMIDVHSEVGMGTKFTITLPVTLAILQALIVRAARETYAIPMNSVMESVLLSHDEVRTVERREVVRLREATLPLVRLERVFELPRVEPPGADLHVVVVALAQHRLGIVVDDFVGRQDIVIKALGKVLSRVPGVAGAADLGNQQTVLVLDVGALIEETLVT